MVMLSFVFLAACTAQHVKHQNDLQVKINTYYYYAKVRLEPYFIRANVPYPPKEITFIVFKDSKKLLLYAKNNQNQWKFIRKFPVLAASGGPGPKLHERDLQVPEGVYRIIMLNPDSHYDLSMELSYPNDFDREHANQDGRTHLGSQIFIHGNRLSAGCIAMGDDVIQQLFVLVYLTGMHNVTVIVAPTDLRHHKPLKVRHPTSWLPELYSQILAELRKYP